MANAIAGIVYPDVFQVTDLIEPMLSPLKHRASGEKHFFTFKNFQLGCFGNGFATDSKKHIKLALDGWIENLNELKKELGIDHLSEEETLIECYIRYGISFLKKITGEFAIVLLDQEKGHLYLAKDPIGKKPLYWYHDKYYFIFASEIKALLATGIVPQTAAPDSIASYLFFGYTPQDMTPIQGVSKLLPSHYLYLNNFHGKQIIPYWSYSSFFEKRAHEHKSRLIAHLDELIKSSVSVRIPETGSLGCIVSGGLGSGTIAYYVKRLAEGHDVKAFTAGFGEYSEEDVESAELVVQSLHMPQQTANITPQYFLDNFAKIVWYLDEPLADPNVIATWKLAQISSAYSKTTYSGMGSDELLAGHSRYTMAERQQATYNRLKYLPEPLVHNFLIPFVNFFSKEKALNLLKMSRTNHWQFEYLRNSALFDESTIQAASPLCAGLFDPETFLHKFHNISRVHSNVSSLLYFDIKTRLPDLYILQYERLMSASGVSWQTPFLDQNLIEYAASLPEPETLNESQAASYLKPLVQDHFPQTFLNRPKKTRKYFLSDWMDHDEIANLFYLLRRGTVIETGIISREWLEEQLATREQMKLNFAQLFAILALEVWFRLFINRAITPSAPFLPLDQLLQEN